MARNRKIVPDRINQRGPLHQTTIDFNSDANKKKKKTYYKNTNVLLRWYIKILAPLLLLGSLCTIWLVWGIPWYVGRMLVSPSYSALIDVLPPEWKDQVMWGTYRPGVYFGTKSRRPHSPVTGMMWFDYSRNGNFRHSCSLSDGLKGYGWTKHDGTSFAKGKVYDGIYEIRTKWLKSEDDKWSTKIDILPANGSQPSPFMFVYYIAIEKGSGSLSPVIGSETQVNWIEGETLDTPAFELKIEELNGENVIHQTFLSAEIENMAHLDSTIVNNLRYVARNDVNDNSKYSKLLGLKGITSKINQNFVAVDFTGIPPLSIYVQYRTVATASITDSDDPVDFEEKSSILEQSFDKKFEQSFSLNSKGYNSSMLEMARYAFSNLIGGIGYHYGSSLVRSQYLTDVQNYWAAELFTGSPSRPVFPRGFLWDEGFHQLILQHFEPRLSIDVVSSWLNLMNRNGWIPREQILGEESRVRVPNEFIVQSDENANPPSFFITIETMMNHVEQMQNENSRLTTEFLRNAYPRLVTWFYWFNTTQNGAEPGSYYWKGRNPKAVNELNPKTLASGLDDYPRATHPDNSERHLDLYCWMVYASGILAKLAKSFGYETDYSLFHATNLYLRDENHFSRLHWSEKLGYFADYGLHSTNVKLCRPEPGAGKVRCEHAEPTHKFVDAFGYVSLFPIMLNVIAPDSPKLDVLLDKILHEHELWSGYGLRSLSKSNSYYLAHNTEHDPPYWRGAIWINMNYMTLKGLKHYSEQAGPYQKKSKIVFDTLKEDVIKCVYASFNKTGFIWEHYDEVWKNNKRTMVQGAGAHPFTGWSSLILLIMADIY